MTHGPESVPVAVPDVDEPDMPFAETDVKSAARTCSVILVVIAGVSAVAVVALIIALING